MSALSQEPHELMAGSGHLTKHEELLTVTQCTVMAKMSERTTQRKKRDFILLCDFIGARPPG